MTARRPPRLCDYSNEIHLADSDSTQENENPTRSNLSSPLAGSPTKSLSPYSSAAVHPLLTDFGPASATQYFREALQSLRLESKKDWKGKEPASSPIYHQMRTEVVRNPRKMHRTVFDDDDSEEGYDDDVVVRGNDGDASPRSYRLNRLQVDAWSEDEDTHLTVTRMRGRRKLRRTPPSWNTHGDLFNQPPRQPNSILPARASDFVRSPFFDFQDFPHLGSAPPQRRRPTSQSQASQLPHVPMLSESTRDHEFLFSIEDPAADVVSTARNAGCGCKILCLCGVKETYGDLPRKSPPQTTKRITRSSPGKLRLGKLRESQSKYKQPGLITVRSSAAASAPTEPSATSRRRRPSRSQDFEEHANEKRRSWRAGGEVDFSDDDFEPSETESTSYLSALASGRSRRLPMQSQPQSVATGNLVGPATFQVNSLQTRHRTQWATQAITRALDGLNDDISAGLLDHDFPRPIARGTASTRNQEQPGNQRLSAYYDEENLLCTNLLFEASEDDEDAASYRLRRRRPPPGSFLRSPPRRRAMLSFQHDASTVGNENTSANPFSPRCVPSLAARPNVGSRSAFTVSPVSTRFDYAALTPQQLPKDIFETTPHHHHYTERRQKATSRSTERRIVRTNSASIPTLKNHTRALTASLMSSLPLHDHESQHSTTWDLPPLKASPNDPPVCALGQDRRGWPDDLPVDIFILITRHLSHEDVRNLRLVNSAFESLLVPIIFRTVVTKFGKSMFDVNLGKWEKKAPKGSMFEKYGMEIHKFGICFEVDLQGLQTATPKVIQNTQSSWWGKYTWPVPKYPRFRSLEILENLADHLPLLRSAFKDLTNVSELALCADSGHGWLNGPDMSDLAIWNLRCSKGGKIFGKNFQAEDKWHLYGRGELFKWAQINTINEALESLKYGSHMEQWVPESQFLKSVAIRHFDSYAVQSEQVDADPERHTGGTVPPTNPNAFNAQYQPIFQQAGGPNWAWQPAPALNHMNVVPHQLNFYQIARNAPRGTAGHHGRQNLRNRVKKGEATQPQWPIIYNGYNLAAETGGHCTFVQNKLADPRTFPLQPGHLTEAQAQWLMETVWAQRAFLSAYTTAILTNKANFKQVHSLHIAKISSGLLPSLEQRELWQALPNLRTLKVLVSPDWRTEYMPGDQSFQNNMLISPVQASIKFADFLQRYVSRVEHLSTLTIGFVGGGEHATGLLARNQHVLPAPITSDPRGWLTDHVIKPNLTTMLAFNHIKNLTIENAWLSPLMLEGFMTKSKDTSLRHLILDSVSLTGVNSQRTNASMTTLEDGLKPEYAPAAWLQEHLPTEHCWPAVIDRLTPGVTFSQLKYDAGLIDPIQLPPPEPSFRGNVEKLTFKSCGYVKISGIPQIEFNQNGLVMPNTNPRDQGLAARESLLRESRGVGEMYGNATTTIMMRDKDAQGHEWFGLGKLTQCIHPVEKRVLEEAWQMRFGWGNDMERFGAVDDGCFEGGTGRFSGEVTK